MPRQQETESRLVTSLVPSLSRSLAEQFNVFRVMHHGTHEKQLSNVFAWLLRADGTHELGDTFQQIFMARINNTLPEGAEFPTSGYRVSQEVDTSGDAATGKDIADIVLMTAQESVVVENFGTSDGHGHDYFGYLAHGAQGGRRSVVVLLCIRRESELQTDGWEQAVVLTYADLLSDLHAHVKADKKWRRDHPQQNFFINELVENFVEGPSPVNTADRIAFIKTMCETGESARYGQRPQDAAAEQFAEILAQHAKQQFEDGRRTLGDAKRYLRQYAERQLMSQVNGALGEEAVASVRANFVGKWEWYVRLLNANGDMVAGLLFGPTAATYNDEIPDPVQHPDFGKVFILMRSSDVESLHQTDISLEDVLTGFEPTDDRLVQTVIPLVQTNHAAQE
ncbi:PD-(D/E)XK nuclease family protein [Leucobacter chironomi]|uniref:PD-(D/E)XK nuclease family protein n=1 Tax=Leucobacter chironomi TaxID=491918 RepID=UPI000975898D|nr:PD-(D/E)XK nuclease family protein [Leucobacter chironomi]